MWNRRDLTKQEICNIFNVPCYKIYSGGCVPKCKNCEKLELRELRREENKILRAVNSYHSEGDKMLALDLVNAVTALLHRLRRLEQRTRNLEGD